MFRCECGASRIRTSTPGHVENRGLRFMSNSAAATTKNTSRRVVFGYSSLSRQEGKFHSIKLLTLHSRIFYHQVRRKLLQEASSVWINFTHIYQLPLSIGMVNESMLVNAWSTGIAFQCTHNQPVIDGFIVGYCATLDEPFQSSRLITIPWKTKAESTAAASVLSHSLTAPFIIPENHENARFTTALKG